MSGALELATPLCVSVELAAYSALILVLGVIVIPATAITLIARLAKRHPSQAVLGQGVDGPASGSTVGVWR